MFKVSCSQCGEMIWVGNRCECWDKEKPKAPVMMEIFWDGEETEVKLTQEFIESHKVLQLDVLIDAKAEIERIYEELLGAKE